MSEQKQTYIVLFGWIDDGVKRTSVSDEIIAANYQEACKKGNIFLRSLFGDLKKRHIWAVVIEGKRIAGYQEDLKKYGNPFEESKFGEENSKI